MNHLEKCAPYFNYINQMVTLDTAAMEIIADNTRQIRFPKNYQIFLKGDLIDRSYFIISGQARSYYTDCAGKTMTWGFHFNTADSIARNIFAVDYRAFLTGRPASVSIETLTDVEALVSTRLQICYLIDHLPAYATYIRKVDERGFVDMFDRAFTLLTLSAADRYNKLLKEEPHLLQLFSNNYIASYLGIAPQSLSRLRANIKTPNC